MVLQRAESNAGIRAGSFIEQRYRLNGPYWYALGRQGTQDRELRSCGRCSTIIRNALQCAG